MLRIDNLSYEQDGFVLSADLTLPKTGIIAIIGPSGAGKSTFLSVLAGLLPQTSGEIFWGAQKISELAPGARPISILFQDRNLFPHLTLEQNLSLSLSKTARIREADRPQISEALGKVGLLEFGARKPGELSGGQQSRAALARVLLAKRPIVLLDEPFAALGPALKSEMLALMSEQLRAAGALVLLVTHDPQDARIVADKVMTVLEGNVAPPVLTEIALNNPTGALQEYLGKP